MKSPTASRSSYLRSARLIFLFRPSRAEPAAIGSLRVSHNRTAYSVNRLCRREQAPFSRETLQGSARETTRKPRGTSRCSDPLHRTATQRWQCTDRARASFSTTSPQAASRAVLSIARSGARGNSCGDNPSIGTCGGRALRWCGPRTVPLALERGGETAWGACPPIHSEPPGSWPSTSRFTPSPSEGPANKRKSIFRRRRSATRCATCAAIPPR